MIRKVIILFLIIIIQNSNIVKSKKWTAEELWEKTKENYSDMKEKRYVFSDINRFFNETAKNNLIKEISILALNIVSNPYVFIINNICCGDVKDENFLNEYTKTLSNLVNKDFDKVNDKKTIIFLLIVEENIFKINIVGSTIKKALGLAEVNTIYGSIKNCLNQKDYYSVIADTCTTIKWIYEVRDYYDSDDDDDEEIEKKEKKEKEQKEKEEKEKKEKEKKEKEDKEDKEIMDDDNKNKNNENVNDKNSNTYLIVIIIFLVFAFCLVLLAYCKMCKKVKILNSEKINFNLYEKLKV